MFHVKHQAAVALPDVAHVVFGDHIDQAVQYVDILATMGVERGLIGPREVDRLWERHVLNCAVVAELVRSGERVLDIGSGAGLPGLPMLMARPEIEVTLLEPMQRRIDFLRHVADALTLPATVERGRAGDTATVRRIGSFDVVVSRAVAPLDRLAQYSLPLVRRGGRMIAIKGARAAEELAQHGSAIGALGGTDARVVQCGVGLVEPATTVVEIHREGVPGKRLTTRPGGGS